eukprot:TRINITY_DN1299_c0_g1_i1.p2 TRINITY_DN1299_c0_g1~~TRINITY_DN1299_c0_g1_i1.p2  ORF type:complete len:509 (-),score=67.58 TRINITY_DN1299_c0_g1_i1:90-1616(-)
MDWFFMLERAAVVSTQSTGTKTTAARSSMKNQSIQEDGITVKESDNLLPYSTYEKEKVPFFYFSRRWTFIFLCHIGLLVCYSLRVNLSIAILPMAEEAHWGESQKAKVLSSFFWGYIFTQLPGGWLASKYGGKYLFGFGILLAGIGTAITPYTIHYFWLVLLCRILTGFAEGVTYPAVHALMASWVPIQERSRAIGIAWGGAYVGTVLTTILAPLVVNAYGWRYVFLISGGVAIGWFVLWTILSASSPESLDRNLFVKYISHYEKTLIQTNREVKQISNKPTPFISFFLSLPFWAIIINHFGNNWGGYILLMWLPSYMKDKLGFDLQKSGIFSFLPYMAMAIFTMSSGRIADFIIQKKLLSVVGTRKLMQTLGMISPALFLSITSFTNPTKYEAVAYMVCAVGLNGFVAAGYGVNHIDISPKYAGTLYGITNTAATIPGIVGVYVTGPLLQKYHGDWSVVFMIAVLIYVFAYIFYLFFASGKLIDFDKDYEERFSKFFNKDNKKKVDV